MEFHEKLQALRKQKGLTQEELAAQLFVSRAAVSKWESGRGYPGIDSLKAVSRFFSVSIDDLLSGDEVLQLAQEDQLQKQSHLRTLVFGLLDCSALVFLFLPLFTQHASGAAQAVSLLGLTGLSPLVTAACWCCVILTVLSGILMLALQGRPCPSPLQHRDRLSLLINAAGALLMMITRQPYAASFLFVFLIIKVMLLLKRP